MAHLIILFWSELIQIEFGIFIRHEVSIEIQEGRPEYKICIKDNMVFLSRIQAILDENNSPARVHFVAQNDFGAAR